MKFNEQGRIEGECRLRGFSLVCGVDEVGRGPVAGPTCAAAVILPEGFRLPGLDDSKRVSEKKREALYEMIVEGAVTYGVAFASVEEIETLGINPAVFLAMNRAIAQLDPAPELALIDGNNAAGVTGVRVETIVGGDGKCASIAAASILAKVTRDRLMCYLAEKYPEYLLEKHKGYGTKAHYEAILTKGPCEIHRLSFLKNLLQGTGKAGGPPRGNG